MKYPATCSNKPRPTVPSNKHGAGFKTAQCVWGKDPWHIRKSGVSTLCGIDCSEWLRMDDTKPDHNLCDRCRKKLPEATQ